MEGIWYPSRDRYSTCRGVTRIKVPLTPVAPMGRVALYANAPHSTTIAPTLQSIKAAVDRDGETGVECYVCVCVCLCVCVLN